MGNLVAVIPPAAEFKIIPPYQDQKLVVDVESADDYVKRGGVAHFRGAQSGVNTICGGKIGASVSRWRNVTCIYCFRTRAGIRKAIGKR